MKIAFLAVSAGARREHEAETVRGGLRREVRSVRAHRGAHRVVWRAITTIIGLPCFELSMAAKTEEGRIESIMLPMHLRLEPPQPP